MDLFYALEVTVYSFLQFIPCILLALYPFRSNLRYSRLITALGVLLNACVHAACNFLKSYGDYDGMLSMACTLVHVFFMFLWIRDHWGKGLFTLLMMTNISNFLFVLSKCMEGLVVPALAAEPFHWTNSVFILVSELLVLAPLFFYMRGIHTRAVTQSSAATPWRYLWLIPLTFYAVWFRNFYFSQEGAMELALRPRHALFSLVINSGAMLTYWMVAQLINESEKNRQLQAKEHNLMMQHAQYGNLKDRIDEARRAKHDIRQHLHVISAYLKDQKYGELEEYIGRYRRTVPEESTLVYCDNYAVNALLQYFSGYAKMIGCGLNSAVQLPNDTGIPDEVLSVVLGNLLENAVEACVNEGSGSLVSVRGKKDDTAVFFKIVNTCSHPPKQDKSGRYLSSKRKAYGIGISSVQSIAQQYNGMMKAHWENGTFTVSVLLSIPEI